MSKAFDSLDRNTLLEELSKVLNENELHLMYLLIVDVELKIRVGDEESENFITNIGSCQGDCLSALLFIFYLAKALTGMTKHRCAEDHKHRILWSALSKDKHNLEIDPKYADEINFVRLEKSKINQITRTLPRLLEEKNLIINRSKTEEYDIGEEGDEKWKSCKILGSLLDTTKDIDRRRGLTIDTIEQ